MQITGMINFTQRGGKPILYLTRGDTAKVQALDLNGTNVALSGGRYVSRPILGRNEESEKRGIVFVQEGECAAGTFAEATVTFVLDDNRRLSFSLRGPYDRNKKILFYQRLPFSAATFRACPIDLSEVKGVDVELGKHRMDYVEKD